MRWIFRKADSERRDAHDGFPRSVHMMIEPASAGTQRLAMGIETVDPGSQIPVHVHEHAEEILFVYAGHGRARVGDDEVEVGPETAIFVAPGAPHGFVNTSDGDARLAWVFAPPGDHEKFRDEAAWKHARRAPPASPELR
jgi:mannose-6-phosphate isomerase-like protein (cupin superfamily)